MASSRPTAQDIRAAAETHEEIAPEYKDAVVASFLDRIDQHIAARVDEQLGRAKRPAAARRARGPAEPTRGIVLRSVLAGSALTGIPLSIFVFALGVQGQDDGRGNTGWGVVLLLLWVAIIVGNFAFAGWYRRPPR
jgi:hypothetical protein